MIAGERGRNILEPAHDFCAAVAVLAAHNQHAIVGRHDDYIVYTVHGHELPVLIT
jgi:hypothetical protein